MSNRSFSQQWASLSTFWKFIFAVILISMPWTIIFIIWGIWHLDSRIEDLHQEIESSNKKTNDIEINSQLDYLYQNNPIKPPPIDTIDEYKKLSRHK